MTGIRNKVRREIMIIPKRIVFIDPKQTNVLKGITPAVVKQASKNEQASLDFFQKSQVSNSVPTVFNRETKRLFDKLHKVGK